VKRLWRYLEGQKLLALVLLLVATGNAAAQKPFLQGLALLHSFVYGDAADDFRAAQKADPDFALAYWAEALTNTHVVWGEEDLAAAHAALAKLGDSPAARLAHARTPRERAFGAAVEGLYAAGDQRARVRAFADSMRTWVAAMPADEEANVEKPFTGSKMPPWPAAGPRFTP